MITVSIALNEKRTEASELVSSVYTGYGYLKPEENDYLEKVNHYNSSTITLIAEKNGVMIGTLSLIIDSELGLPMDTLYSDELDPLRRNGRRLCELSQFAVSEGGLKAGLLLCKYAKVVADDLLGMTDFVITANPKHRTFYLSVLQFEELAEEKVYPNLSEVGAAPLILDLVTFEGVYQAHSEKGRSFNLHDYFFGSDINTVIEEMATELEGIPSYAEVV